MTKDNLGEQAENPLAFAPRERGPGAVCGLNGGRGRLCGTINRGLFRRGRTHFGLKWACRVA